MLWRLFLVLVGCLVLLGALAHRNALPYRVHAVLSGSMGSTAPQGSLILSKRQAEYQIGDIITFPYPANERESITHRVVRVTASSTGTYVETKGDANPNGDGWKVPIDRLMGRVELVIPFLGWGVLALQTPIGYLCFALGTLLFFVLPLLRLAFLEVRSLRSQE